MSKKLITQLNPFSNERQIEQIECSNIQEIINKIDTHKTVNTGWRVLVNDEIITDFEHQLKDGDTVYIKLVPEGDNKSAGVGEKVAGGIMAAAGVALLVFTSGILSNVGVALIGGGISLFLSGVAMFNMDVPKSNQNKAEQSPSIRGSRNQSRPMGYIPILLGKRRIYADVASNSYTWVDDEGNQYLYQLFCVAQKDILIDSSTIKIGDTDIKEFSESKNINKILDKTDKLVQLDIAYGQKQVPVDFNKCVHEEVFNKVIKKDIDGTPGDIPYTTPDDVNQLMIDFFCPNGLGKYNDKGELTSVSVTVEVLYKYATDVSSEYVSLGTVTLSAKELKTKRARLYKTLTKKGKLDLVVRRLTDDYTDSKTIGDVYLGSIRAIKDEAAVSSTRTKQLTLISMKLKASEKINNFVDQLNFEAQSYLPSYDSGNDIWTRQLSSNPASAAVYAMQGEPVQQKLGDEEIDFNSFKQLYTWCKNHEYECNEYVYDQITISELLSAIGSTCRAEILRQFGKITVIQDIEKSGFTQIFTPRNSWNYQEQILFPSIPDAMSIEFIDKDTGYAEQELKVYNTADGNRISEPDTVQDISLWGVTSSIQARKLGMYKYAVTKNRPFIHKFSADFEYLLCQKGDWIKYAGDIALAGISQGRITNVIRSNGKITGITADEDFPMEQGKQYAVRIRKSDGSAIIRNVVNSAATSRTVSFVQSFNDDDVKETDLVVFGTTGNDTIDLIVTDIQCGENLTADIIAVEYAPEIFGVDSPDFVLPDFVNKISDIPGTQDYGTVNQSDWQNFLTYHDGDTVPARPTGNGTADGWHRNPTSESMWMSSKIAPTVNVGEWSEPYPNPDRGPGIINVTTAPEEYTTQIGDVQISYRITKFAVISQSNMTKVIVGDTIANDYYLYPVLLLDSIYVYLGARSSIRGPQGGPGKDGVSPTITTSKSGSTTTITIKDATGTETATINDGSNGVSLTNKNNWASSVTYSVNDYVYYTTNKTSYVCRKAHTSSSSILPTNTTYWSVLATSGTDGKDGTNGKDGSNGKDGADGKDATQYYIHYVYTDDLTAGTNYSTDQSRKYIGIYTDTTQADASTFAIANAKTGIVWSEVEPDLYVATLNLTSANKGILSVSLTENGMISTRLCYCTLELSVGGGNWNVSTAITSFTGSKTYTLQNNYPQGIAYRISIYSDSEKTNRIATANCTASPSGTATFTSDYAKRSWTNAQWTTYNTAGKTESWYNSTVTNMKVGDILAIPVTLTEQGNITGIVYYEITSIPTAKGSNGYYSIPSKFLYGMVGQRGQTGSTGATGTRGSLEFSGTQIYRQRNGENTETINTGSIGITSNTMPILVGDTYVNSLTQDVWKCTTAGTPCTVSSDGKFSDGTAKWTWQERRLSDIDTNNMMRFFSPSTDYSSISGSTYSKSVITGVNPFGENDLLLKVTKSSTSGSGRVVPYNQNMKLDSNKTYRYVCYVKQVTTNNTDYFGIRGYTDGGDACVQTLAGANTNSGYFTYSANFGTAGKWYLIVGYVVANDKTSAPSDSGVYDVATGKKIKDCTNYRWKNFGVANYGHTGTLIGYTSSATTNTIEKHVYDMRFDVVDGNEPTIDELLHRDTSNNIIYYKDLAYKVAYVVGYTTNWANANQVVVTKGDILTINVTRTDGIKGVMYLKANESSDKGLMSTSMTINATIINIVWNGESAHWNMLPNSKFQDGTTGWTADSGTITVANDSLYGTYANFKASSGNRRMYHICTGNLEAGKTYVISFVAKASVKDAVIKFSRALVDYTDNQKLTTDWLKYSLILNVTDTSNTLSFVVGDTTSTFSITNIMVEEGTQASDWTTTGAETKGDKGDKGDSYTVDVTSIVNNATGTVTAKWYKNGSLCTTEAYCTVYHRTSNTNSWVISNTANSTSKTGTFTVNGINAYTYSAYGTRIVISSSADGGGTVYVTYQTGGRGRTGSTGSRAIRYLGKTANTTPTTKNPVFSPAVTTINGDWYLCTTDGGVYYRTAENVWAVITWTDTSTTPDYRLLQAIDDILVLSKTLTTNATINNLVNRYIDCLIAGKLFGKEITVLTGGYLKSEDYDPATKKGFMIKSNDNGVGSIESYNGLFAGITGDVKSLGNTTTTGLSYVYKATKSATYQAKLIISKNGYREVIADFIITDYYNNSSGTITTKTQIDGIIYKDVLSITRGVNDVTVTFVIGNTNFGSGATVYLSTIEINV